MEKLTALAARAAEVVKGAGELIRSMKKPEVYSKEGHSNYVTEADLASQQYLLERLAPLLPETHFFAEEQEQNVMEPGFNWVIDPIDGTTNFMRGHRHSAISVGLVRDGEAVLGLVYNPYAEELFSAVRGEGAYLNGERLRVSGLPLESGLVVFGTSPYYRELLDETFDAVREIFRRCGDIRRSGSAALDLCDVAAGRCDGFYEGRLSPWDYAASAVILEEAGGKIGTAAPFRFGFEEKIPIVAGNGLTFAPLLEIAEKAAGRG